MRATLLIGGYIAFRTLLLVLSEIDYPAWHAYVDYRLAETYTADGALRAVPVPEGQHTVEFRFESAPLQVGILISCVTTALVAGLAVSAIVFGRVRRE